MKKILAIDDNIINLELIGQILKVHFPDFQYIYCKSGIEGIESALKESPEIIILDILMPEMDGYEVCKILKNNRKTQNIPVIMISALGNDPIERTKGLNAGADIFLGKPFNLHEFKAHVNVVLRIKNAEDLLRKRNESLEISIKAQTKKYLQSEERYSKISANAKEFYWEIDSKGVFTFISPIVEKILHIKPEDIVSKKSFTELFQLKENITNKIQSGFNNHSNFKDFEIELNKGKKQNSIWISVSGLAIFKENQEFFGFKGVGYDITKYKKTELALKKNVSQVKNYQKRLKDLNNELLLAEETEKRRIAENIHDGFGQTLSLAYLKLSSINDVGLPPNEKKIITETAELINQAIKDSRNITYDLCPPILYELGLIPALNWRLDTIKQNYGIKTEFVSRVLKISIQKEYNIFVYRIINELFANCIKHANASLINLEIKKIRNQYHFTIADNGVGFNTNTFKTIHSGNHGFGLFSIIERLDSLKGKFSIKSKPGKGTIATVVVPSSEKK